MRTVLLFFGLFLLVACPEPPARPAFLQPNIKEPEPPPQDQDLPEPEAVPEETTSHVTETPKESPPVVLLPVAEVPVSESPVEEVETPPEKVAKIVINELYYDAVGSDTNGVLFIELYGNPSSDLSGFQINLVNGDDGKIYQTLTLPDGAMTGADGYFLIADAKTGSTTESFVAGSDWITNFDPQNGPDALQLLNVEGEFLDALGYGALALTTTGDTYPLFEGSTAPDVTNGHSLERKTPGLDTDDNLADFVDREVSTPGF